MFDDKASHGVLVHSVCSVLVHPPLPGSPAPAVTT